MENCMMCLHCTKRPRHPPRQPGAFLKSACHLISGRLIVSQLSFHGCTVRRDCYLVLAWIATLLYFTRPSHLEDCSASSWVPSEPASLLGVVGGRRRYWCVLESLSAPRTAKKSLVARRAHLRPHKEFQSDLRHCEHHRMSRGVTGSGRANERKKARKLGPEPNWQ